MKCATTANDRAIYTSKWCDVTNYRPLQYIRLSPRFRESSDRTYLPIWSFKVNCDIGSFHSRR